MVQGGGINLGKTDSSPYYEQPVEGVDYQAGGGGINLDKTDDSFRTTNVAPPPMYEEEPRKHNANVVPDDHAPRGNQQPQQVSVNNSQLFHIISIIFVLLSLIFSPLLALVPVILFCIMQGDLKANNDPIWRGPLVVPREASCTQRMKRGIRKTNKTSPIPKVKTAITMTKANQQIVTTTASTKSMM